MQIRYTNHARQRMRERKVSEQQVETTILFAEELLAGEQGEWIAVRVFEARRIQIVYGELDEEIVLVYTVINNRLSL